MAAAPPLQTRERPAATGRWDRTSTSTRNHRNTSGNPFEQVVSAHQSVTGYREQKTGKGARITCAACGTKAYKVAIAEGDNGTVLMHAFCGHTPREVLGAMGLQMAVLFPRRELHSMTPAERSQLRQAALIPRWRAALEVLSHEATVLLIAANKMGDGDLLDDDELTRMRVAALKVFDCSEVLTNAR